MKYLASLFILLLATPNFFGSAFGAEPTGGKCDIGPLNKIYGNAPWFVYSCTTDKNVVIVSAPGAAMPFVFAFFAKDGGYQLSGEGTGKKEVTDAAFNELKLLTQKNIEDLILQTKQVQLEGKKHSGK